MNHISYFTGIVHMVSCIANTATDPSNLHAWVSFWLFQSTWFGVNNKKAKRGIWRTALYMMLLCFCLLRWLVFRTSCGLSFLSFSWYCKFIYFKEMANIFCRIKACICKGTYSPHFYSTRSRNLLGHSCKHSAALAAPRCVGSSDLSWQLP